jgi:hypothetical protein
MVRTKNMKLNSEKLKKVWNELLHIEMNGNTLYFVSFTVFIIASFLKTTMLTPQYFSVHILNYIEYMTVVILGFKWMFFSKFTIPQFIIDVFVFLFSLLAWRKTNDPQIFYMALLVLCARGMSFKQIIKWYVVLTTTLLLFTIVLADINVIRNLTYVRGEYVRQAFGIIYPTDFAAHIFYLTLGYVYLFYKKMKVGSYILIFLFTGLLYSFTNARLDAVLLIMIVPMIFLVKKRELNNEFSILDFSWMSTIVFAFFTFISTIFYVNTGLLSKINELISSRISLSNEGYQKYGISLFGRHVKEHGWGGLKGFKNFQLNGQLHQYFVIDSSFARLLLIYGVVAFVIVVIAMSYLAFRSIRQKNYILVGILFLVGLSCLIDQHIFELTYNPFLIAVCASTINIEYDKKVGKYDESFVHIS